MTRVSKVLAILFALTFLIAMSGCDEVTSQLGKGDSSSKESSGSLRVKDIPENGGTGAKSGDDWKRNKSKDLPAATMPSIDIGNKTIDELIDIGFIISDDSDWIDIKAGTMAIIEILSKNPGAAEGYAIEECPPKSEASIDIEGTGISIDIRNTSKEARVVPDCDFIGLSVPAETYKLFGSIDSTSSESDLSFLLGEPDKKTKTDDGETVLEYLFNYGKAELLVKTFAKGSSFVKFSVAII